MLYTRDFPNTEIFVLDNGNQDIKSQHPPHSNLRIAESTNNLGVGKSWNVLCEKIYSVAENALILNDDIYLGKKEADIEQLIHKKKNKGCFLRATPDWCAFVIPKKIYEKVGEFDECFFPAYYEDNSYAYRMKLMGLIPIKTPELNPMVYKSSSTMQKDLTIAELSKRNRELYIEMWGGAPNEEKFKTPFNK
jgi:GT2 family glycosyltransferase